MKSNHPIHDRRSIRLPDYDYSQPGAYFITIVTHRRECLFGEVVDGEMRLNDAGRIVEAVWLSLPVRYPGVALGAAVVMPNHFHGIVEIHEIDHDPVGATHEMDANPDHAVGATHEMDANHDHAVGATHEMDANPDHPVGATHEMDANPDHAVGATHEMDANPDHPVGAIHELPLPDPQDRLSQRKDRRRMTLPLVVGYFKMNTAKRINQILGSPGVPVWQRNYYEHIIRNAEEHHRIHLYMIANTVIWAKDAENPGKRP